MSTAVAPTMNTPELHEALRQYRKEAGVSADAVAEVLNVKASSLRSRERGEREWYPDLVDRYVAAVQACEARRREEARRQEAERQRLLRQQGQQLRRLGRHLGKRTRVPA